jgi:fructose-1,6-bisphosphatase/inositol monophosphatase family enzyme
VWTIDPIDGTTTYYHGFPIWAIAVGLYKDYKPYMGAIYAPALKELIYTDGIGCYHLKNAFTKTQKIITIAKKRTGFFSDRDVILHHKICDSSYKKYSIIDFYSSYIIGFYTLTGRSIASFFGESSKLWDISATLPLAKSIGFCFRNIKNDKNLDCLSRDLVDKDWKLKDTYIMCCPNLYDVIKADNIVRRNDAACRSDV